MRQFFSWRVWFAFAALVGLTLLLKVVLPADASKQSVANGPPERTVDFVSFIYQVQPGTRFFILDGVVSGSADVIIDGQRTMHIVEGTPGAINCPDYEEIGRCVVVADLLGDAVVWFEIVPVRPGYKVNAAPVVEIVDDTLVRLDNGWLIRTANSVDRRCKQETGSLSEFITNFGPGSTTIIDVATQKVSAVVCADTDPTESSTTVPTPTTVAATLLPGSATSIAIPSTSIPNNVNPSSTIPVVTAVEPIPDE